MLHESVPGHHLQSALAREMPGVPPFQRAFTAAAFGEGWALYAESLGPDLGVYRDHTTTKPITYYNKLSVHAKVDVCYIVDPMLATGGSAIAALGILKEWNIPSLRFLAIIAAPEGVKVLQKAQERYRRYEPLMSQLLDKADKGSQPYPLDQRAAFLLTEVEGLTIDEAASALAIPPGTVKSRSHHARLKLRKLLGPTYGEPHVEPATD